jgi:AbrB family looped-hinge helix DNA binding protein
MTEKLTGTRIAERLMARPGGALMDEIIAATGSSQYNVIRRLESRGYQIRKTREGRATRYFVEPPAAPVFETMVNDKGRVTIPQQVREQLGLRSGQMIRFSVEGPGRAIITPASGRLSDLAGILPRPTRTVTLEEMDEAIRRAAGDPFSPGARTKR